MKTTTPQRFETLIESYHDEIYSYLWRLLESAGGYTGAVDAQDLIQEVFLRAYRAFERLRPGSNYRAWLYKIATNCAYTALKQGSRSSAPLPDDVVDTNPSPHQQAVQNETLAAIREALAGLPPKQQAAVVMRHVQGLEYAEIAQALGCSDDSARANVYQAIRRLRRELAEDGGSDNDG